MALALTFDQNDANLETEEDADLGFEPSENGMLHMTALKAYTALIEKHEAPFRMCIFEDHHRILAAFIDASQVGTQAPAVLDSVLILGWAAMTWNRGYVKPNGDDSFFDYLHRLNAVSSDSPIASLRYQYHLFSSIVLHSHPSSKVRLRYITDTLVHCPYANLRVAAVGWLRSETAAAFNVTPSIEYRSARPFQCPQTSREHEENVFATPSAITSVASHLFATPTVADDSEVRFQAQFWLATLNLLYFVYSSHSMCADLAIHHLIDIYEIQLRFLDNLDSIVTHAINSGNGEHGAKGAISLADAYALEDALKRVKHARSRCP